MRFTRSGQKWSSDVLRRRPEERDVAVQRRIDENVVQSVRAIPANLEQDERRMSQAEVPIYHFLANIPLLRNATPESIERVAEGTRRVFANKGETLFRRGDPCKGFWIVLYGQVIPLGWCAVASPEVFVRQPCWIFIRGVLRPPMSRVWLA